MRRWPLLGVLFWSSTTLAQTAPLGPGKPGQKKLPPRPASQPTSQPTSQKVTPVTEAPPKPQPPTSTKTTTQEPSPTASITPSTAPTSEPTKRPTKKPTQGWLRVAGRSAQFRPEAVGGAADVFFLRSVLRLGGRVEDWRFNGLVGAENLVLGAGVIGLAYPAKVTPFVEAYVGGGLWHQVLFDQEIFNKTRVFGIEAGAEVYVSSLFFVFASGGYSEASREVDTFDGVVRESFGGSSFRFGVGVAK